MKLLYYSLALYLSLTSPASAASTPKEDPVPDPPCTVTSPYTGNFFDLQPVALQDPGESKAKNPRDYSWNATGWDLGYNFTINICNPVLEKVEDVVGVDEHRWVNISAYYEHNGKTYSIGEQNSRPVMRGRKLVLNYTNGSPCGDPHAHLRHDIGSLDGRADLHANLSHDGGVWPREAGGNTVRVERPIRRKNTVISMLCNKDPLASELSLSFLASPDECSYFFEARSPAACLTANEKKQALNPAGVFGVIAMIAIIVYIVGGCVYSRVVLQQRGWRQLPNYSLWAGIFGFFKDLLFIIFSSCSRVMPFRRGYSRLNGNGNGATGWRGRADSEVENRLIDELNEEWED